MKEHTDDRNCCASIISRDSVACAVPVTQRFDVLCVRLNRGHKRAKNLFEVLHHLVGRCVQLTPHFGLASDVHRLSRYQDRA